VTKNCWDKNNCVLFSNNKAGEQSFGAGGALFNSSSTANIKRATFSGNRADFGSAIYGSGLNSTTNITGSIFHHNGDGGGNVGANGFSDNYVIRTVSDAVLHLLSSTITDNNATLGVLGISTSTTTTSTILSSIIFDAASGNVFAGGSSGYFTDCILAHETNSFINVGNSSSTVDPIFLDPSNANYHIARFSPAIDYCDNLMQASDEKDIDLENRGYNDPSFLDLGGPYDVGADETYATDIIFKNGFE
jgi:predicted outer membrane repeat protein